MDGAMLAVDNAAATRPLHVHGHRQVIALRTLGSDEPDRAAGPHEVVR